MEGKILKGQRSLLHAASGNLAKAKQFADEATELIDIFKQYQDLDFTDRVAYRIIQAAWFANAKNEHSAKNFTTEMYKLFDVNGYYGKRNLILSIADGVTTAVKNDEVLPQSVKYWTAGVIQLMVSTGSTGAGYYPLESLNKIPEFTEVEVIDAETTPHWIPGNSVNLTLKDDVRVSVPIPVSYLVPYLKHAHGISLSEARTYLRYAIIENNLASLGVDSEVYDYNDLAADDDILNTIKNLLKSSIFDTGVSGPSILAMTGRNVYAVAVTLPNS